MRFTPEGGFAGVLFNEGVNHSTGLAFDNSGNAFVALSAAGMDVRKLSASGALLDGFDLENEIDATFGFARRIEWIALEADQRTLGSSFWAAGAGIFGERFIYRFDTGTGGLLAEIRVSNSVAIGSLAIRGETTLTPPPELTIAADLEGRVLISWPATTTGFILEFHPSADWVTFGSAPVPVDGRWTVEVIPTASPEFFRLRMLE